MTGDAGPVGRSPRVRRPGRSLVTAVGVLLLLSGGTAVGAGLLGQDADPPAPPDTATAAAPPSTGTTPEPSGTGPGAPPANPGALPAPTAAPVPSPTSTAASVPAPLPVSVSIPAIDVSSELITVGLDPDGTLQVPQPGPDYDKAAWFDGSPRPGEVGPAVVEGHVDSAANGPSVFYDLGALTPGDRIEVAREDGSVVTFEVDDVRAYPKDDFPTLAVYGNTQGPELRLITCGGPFDSSAGHYTDNTVVFASQV